MKIITQGHEILTQKDLSLIEAAGRTCYKSEDKITKDSAERFCNMLKKRGHEAMLEHASIIMVLSEDLEGTFQLFPELNKYIHISNDGNRNLISGNLRAWRDIIRPTVGSLYPFDVVSNTLYQEYPILFEEFQRHRTDRYEVIDQKDLDLTSKSSIIHASASVRFITNRGVTHELVRHRPASFAQESTRYVKYDGNMEFIAPVWFNEDNLSSKIEVNKSYSPEEIFLSQCVNSETAYKDLLQKGWRPEQAREVLPNALKTEIVVTADFKEWRHIFKLRALGVTGKPHPQMQALMIPVLEEFKQRWPTVFGDLKLEGK